MARPQQKLKVVPDAKNGYAIGEPPVLDASHHTIEFLCGNCGTVLLHAKVEQVHGVIIHCTECGATNATGS
jgi:predicted RNA-binding Zn-ribbon protein involved in translation (DUF1610 family)